MEEAEASAGLRMGLATGSIRVNVLVAAAAWLAVYLGDTPDLAELERFAPQAPGETQTRIKSDCVTVLVSAVPYAQVPNSLRQAVSSVEGNAIALQIARSLFCNTQDGTLQRASKELLVTVELEHRLSKDQLLIIYMNRAYFGEEVIGVEGAARHFFGRNADRLTLPQAALLAGMMRSPALYSPDRHPQRALERRNAVLDAMLQQGKISAAEAEAAKKAPLQ